MRDLSRTMKAVLAAAATVGVAVGAGGIASAVDNAKPSSPEADDAQEPAYTSSVTIDDVETDNEADESAALAGLAKITADQARDAALAVVPAGTAGEVELENENGNVVYGVEVTDASGAEYDVKVDAGSGTVLAQEADDDEEAEDEEAEDDDEEGVDHEEGVDREEGDEG